MPVDPAHDPRRATAKRIGVLLLLLGIPSLAIGGYFFVSSYFGTAGSAEAIVVGVFLLAVGAGCVAYGVRMLTFARGR